MPAEFLFNNFCMSFDGNWELAEFSFFIEGFIDCHSKFVHSWALHDNNRASSVGREFLKIIAENEGYFPHAIEIDAGVENYCVAGMMRSAFECGIKFVPDGIDQLSWQFTKSPIHVISSHANIRIERRWVEVNDITRPFKEYFNFLHACGTIDKMNPFDIAIVHIAFQDEIQRRLNVHREAHNHHRIRHQKSNRDIICGIPITNWRTLPSGGLWVENYEELCSEYIELYIKDPLIGNDYMPDKVMWVKNLWTTGGLIDGIPWGDMHKNDFHTRFNYVKGLLVDGGFPMTQEEDEN